MNTIYRLLKYNRMLKSHHVKYAGLLMADILNIRHLSVRIDPVLACNLRCRMCYFSDADWRNNNKGVLTDKEIERIAEMLFPKALQLVIGCSAEPTLYRDFVKILKLGKDYGVPYVSIVSNGQLLTDEHVECFISHRLDELMLSTHGVKKDTYEYMMPGASYDKLIDILRLLKVSKMKRNSLVPQLRMNYTANPDNIEELENFFDVYGNFDINILQIRPVMDLGNTTYTNKDMSGHFEKYRNVIRKLSEVCKRKNIVFMANTADPTYRSNNPIACISDEVLRKVSPHEVWKSDYLWKIESYAEYCKRIKWRKHLLKSIFVSADKLYNDKKTMTYEVNM